MPVLITGESGVGKDVVAREIHARSARAGRVFVKINCAALPGELLESGAVRPRARRVHRRRSKTKPGQFELADGGTLFLDEIGEMPLALQAKLLQALQDGEFYRVGGQRKIKVDARVIAATNVDLGEGDGARHLPRGSLLSTERRRSGDPAAARAARGHPAAARALRRQVRQALRAHDGRDPVARSSSAS